MKHIFSFMFLALLGLMLISTFAFAGGSTRVPHAIWAHGELYDTVITRTSFVAPPEHSTNVIYSVILSGLSGQRSVAESAPGDPSYNGGRWNVMVAVFTPQGINAHGPDGDGIVNFELTNSEDVMKHEALGHIIINDANFYFECPCFQDAEIDSLMFLDRPRVPDFSASYRIHGLIHSLNG